MDHQENTISDNIIHDNIIKWIFDKIFDQLTLDSSELNKVPFEKIKNKTFSNQKIYDLINKLSNKPFDVIINYLNSDIFQKKFLFSKIKKKINVGILLNDFDYVKNLLTKGYHANIISIRLAILNNRFEILKFLLNLYSYQIENNAKKKYEKIKSNKIILTNDLLLYCVEFGYQEIYFYLKSIGLVPNISIYHKAILGGSLVIIKDIDQLIGLSTSTLNMAFQTNHTDLILFLIKEAINEKIKISSNLIAYPILNANLILLNELEKLNLIEWHHELYFSALLSGSIEMIHLLESKIPNIHDNYLLDTSKSKKRGHSTILLEEMIYYRNHKKYFAHTINYAIQSGSLEIVKYIYSKNYGIAPSNFVTAIKQGIPEILEFIASNHKKSLNYLIYYLGINNYLSNKMELAKILIKYEIITINPISGNKAINDLKRENIHLEMIQKNTNISEDVQFDIDYLMKYALFFVPIGNNKLDYQFLTKIRICLELNLENDLYQIINSELNDIDLQFLVDSIYLFGNIKQINQFYPLILLIKKIRPSYQIIMEILCYHQIGKLSYLIKNQLLDNSIIEKIYQLIIVLDDTLLLNMIGKLYQKEPLFKYIILSGNKIKINNFLDKFQNDLSDLEINDVKELLLIEDIDLIKKIKINQNKLDELIDWMEESDLLELKSIILSQ